MSIPPETRATVMIVSDDAVAAALLGGLVETLGYQVEFAAVRESYDGRHRVKPRVCMLDCESDACGEPAIARCMMRGISVVLVGPHEVLDGMRELAIRYGVHTLFTPPEPEPLGDILDRAVRLSP